MSTDMTPIELAEYLETGYDTYMHDAAEVIRKQQKAIVKLREVLEGSVAYTELLEAIDYRLPDPSQIKSKQVLKDTANI
jgi:hypothetical protein